MSEPECPHGFSSPQWCEDCTPRSKPEPTGPAHLHAIKAQYRGRCAECRDPIEEGDWILSGPRGGWIHDECG